MLPTSHTSRIELHAEIHARPHARIRIPALVTNVSVLSAGITVKDELHVLRQFPGQSSLSLADMTQSFLRLRIDDYLVKWERHGEFTRYSITQALPSHADWDSENPDISTMLNLPAAWLASTPGKTISATQLALIQVQPNSDEELLANAKQWLGSDTVVAARIGAARSQTFSFETMVLYAMSQWLNRCQRRGRGVCHQACWSWKFTA